MEVDLIIRNGRVFDGSGAPSRNADVLIEQGKVLKIERNPVPVAVARSTLPASG